MSRVTDAVNQAKLRLERARVRFSWLNVLMSTFKRFSEDDGGSYAAALTYYVFFSIFPLLTFAVAVVGYATFFNPGLEGELIEAGRDAVPLLNSVLTNETLASIQARAGSIALVTLVLALYSGSGAVVALTHALNKINHIDTERNFLGKRLASLKWLGLVGVIGILSLVPSGLAQLQSAQTGALSVGLAAAGYVAGAVISAIAFWTAFKLLPAAKMSWSEVLPGAVVAGVAFELLKLFGAFYLTRGTAGRNATFGAFAAAAGLLVVSYLLSQVTLLTAELNAVLAERRLTRQSLLNRPKGANA